LSYQESYGPPYGKENLPAKGRPFGSYSKKTYKCLQSNSEAISSIRNGIEYDETAIIDLCPMVRHSKYRWIFNTQKLDRDIPRSKYEERTLAEKEAYDIKYPDDYDKRVYDFYSWRYHHKRKQLPETTKTNKISTAAKYGQYVPRDNSETISSVDSD
jgi:hypothetical protein